eukprot:956840-Rhodomonas_salina.1
MQGAIFLVHVVLKKRLFAAFDFALRWGCVSAGGARERAEAREGNATESLRRWAVCGTDRGGARSRRAEGGAGGEGEDEGGEGEEAREGEAPQEGRQGAQAQVCPRLRLHLPPFMMAASAPIYGGTTSTCAGIQLRWCLRPFVAMSLGIMATVLVHVGVCPRFCVRFCSRLPRYVVASVSVCARCGCMHGGDAERCGESADFCGVYAAIDGEITGMYDADADIYRGCADIFGDFAAIYGRSLQANAFLTQCRDKERAE